jgi:hypothetical protein
MALSGYTAVKYFVLQRVGSAALAHTITRPVIAVVMGVSGSGKTTVSTLLAAALGCQFQQGDELHPCENVEKMRGGTPLTDAVRMPWLRKIAEEIDSWRARGWCAMPLPLARSKILPKKALLRPCTFSCRRYLGPIPPSSRTA